MNQIDLLQSLRLIHENLRTARMGCQRNGGTLRRQDDDLLVRSLESLVRLVAKIQFEQVSQPVPQRFDIPQETSR